MYTVHWFGKTVLLWPAPFHVYVLRLYNRLSPGVLRSTSVFYVYVLRSGYVPRFMVMVSWLRLRYMRSRGYGYVHGHHSTNLTRRYFDIIYVIKRY